MSNPSYKGPYDLGEIVVDKELLKKENKSFEEMFTCKCKHGACCNTINYTAFLTGSQAGSMGSGNHEAPAKKCDQCKSDAYDSSGKRKTSNGWY